MTDGSISPAFAQNNVPVVLVANNLFAPYAGVFIRSLLDHASEKNNYDIIIFNRNISEENKRLLKSLAAGYANVSIRFYDPSPLFASFHYVDEEHNWPVETFYRIIAPHVLQYSGRIISVDVDMLLRTDIARLMDVDLDGCCIGGIPGAPFGYAGALTNYISWLASKNTRAHGSQAAPKDWEYYEARKNCLNGGLVVYDREKYIQKGDIEAILNTARRVQSTEEGVLYALAGESTKLLDVAWNVWLPVNARFAEMFQYIPEAFDKIYNGDGVYKRAAENPCLLHWLGKPKPWVCPDVPYGGEWWQTALRTPFIGHIIARMTDEQEKRRQYYRERYGAENVDIWDPSPKGIDRAKR